MVAPLSDIDKAILVLGSDYRHFLATCEESNRLGSLWSEARQVSGIDPDPLATCRANLVAYEAGALFAAAQRRACEAELSMLGAIARLIELADGAEVSLGG